MGARAYAEEVCAAVDPGGLFFGRRILSRDESGRMVNGRNVLTQFVDRGENLPKAT